MFHLFHQISDLSLNRNILLTIFVLWIAFPATISADSLPAPFLLSPSNNAQVTLGQILNGNVLLDWTDVAGAKEYEVHVHGQPPFSDRYIQCTVSMTLFPATSIPGDYWWRVRAYDVSADPGIFSSSRTLSVTGRIDPTPFPTYTPTATPTPNPESIFDLDSSGRIDQADIFLFVHYFRNKDSRADFNTDSLIDAKDLFLIARKWHIHNEVTVR